MVDVRISLVTAFPDFFDRFLTTGVIGRAVDRGLLRVDIIDLREHGLGRYRQIDDYSFGGGGGMVLMPEVLESALSEAKDANIPVIAYDRLLRETDAVSYYTTFDNFKVGVQQGTSLLTGLEASGGVNLDNVRQVAETGVDFISIGALTHSAPSLDISLLLEPI